MVLSAGGGMAAPWPMNDGRPPARKSQASARPLPALWLFALLLVCLALIVPTAVAQDDGGPTASPTPGATLSMGDLAVEVEGITPEVGLVGDILGTDVDEEFQQDQYLLDFLFQWDWQRLLSSGSGGGGGGTDTTDAASTMAAAPFVMCAEGGRAAVEEMMNGWSSPTSYSSSPSRSLQEAYEQENTSATEKEPVTTTSSACTPLYAQSNLTCYVVQGFASDVLNQTVHMEQIKYSAPLPAILKLARGLFVRVSQGRVFVTAEACAAGIRVVLSPGISTDEAAVTAFVASVQDDLRTGAFREKLAAAFPFANETVVSEANDISAATALARVGKAAAVSSSSASFSSLYSSANVAPCRRLRQQLRRQQAAPATTKSVPTGRAAR